MEGQRIPSTQMGQYILEVVKKEHPETVERLIQLVQREYSLSKEEIMDIACHAGLRFTKESQSSLDLKHYLVTTNARWYWVIIALCILTAISVLVLPAINPVVYIRYLLGSIFVSWMPGYCLVKSLFPGKKLEKLELIALSLGTSVVLVPLIAFVLHYTPWGIKATSATIVLIILALALATIAIFREHKDLFKRYL